MTNSLERSDEIIDLNRQLQRANERLTALYESTQTITSTLKLDEVLERLARSTTQVMNADVCAIRLLDETQSRLKIVAAHGLSEAYLQKGLTLENDGVIRYALAGEPINIGDATTDPRWQHSAAAHAEGLRAVLIAPLTGKTEPLGLILTASRTPHYFASADAAFLTAIGRQGGIAIENALAYQTLRKIEEAKSKFVMTVTHELRSPVSTIRSLLRTLMAGYLGALTGDQHDTIARVLHRADFLQALIDDLLDFAAGKSDLHAREARVAVRLDQAVARAAQRLQLAAREKQIDLGFICECDEPHATILATQEGIDRILHNLISNAIKYTPPGGRVAVTLNCFDGHAQIKVSDTGIGIPADALPHLFEEFYRAPNAIAQVKQGTGLGLAITKDLVTRYGGQIAAQSALGQGSVFCVTFSTFAEMPHPAAATARMDGA